MFILTKNPLGKIGAFAASLFYAYAPYHGIQIYVRGSVAEYWAYAIIPLVIYFLTNKKILAASISLAALVLSHNLTAFMSIALLIFTFTLQIIQSSKNKLTIIKYWLKISLLALGLSAFFWLPAILEKNFTNVNSMVAQMFNPLDHFVFYDQLWRWPWGYGGSGPSYNDGLSFILGKLHIIFAAIAVLIFIITRSKNKNSRHLFFFALTTTIFSLFMMLPISSFVWKNIDVLEFLQFPWRFLAFTAFGLSILAGFTIKQISILKTPKLPTVLFVILSAIVFVTFSSKYFRPEFKFPTTDDHMLSFQRVKYQVSNRSDEYRPLGAPQPQTSDSISQSRYQISLSDTDTVSVEKDQTQTYSLNTNLSSDSTLTFNIYSFPGWNVYLDGTKVEHHTSPDTKLIQIKAPQGSHNISARFQNTPVRTIANLITTFTILLILLIKTKKPKMFT